MDNNDKKGFAGFNKLASDVEVEVPTETQTESVNEDKSGISDKQNQSKSNFFKNLFRKKAASPKPTLGNKSGNKGNYGWIVVIIIMAIIRGFNHDNKTSTTPGVTPLAVTQRTPSKEISTTTVSQPATSQANFVPSQGEFEGIPLPINYHPHIQPYKPTPVLGAYHDLEDSGDPITEDVFKKFSSMANNNLDAQYVEAVFTKYGKGTKKDEKRGNFMLLVSAQNEHPDGLRDASYQFDGMLKVDYLMRAALLGDPAAEFLVGQNYYNGKIIPQDNNKALYWFVKSAEQLYPGAQLAIGVMYLTGEGMPKDDNKAFLWIMKAAKQLNPPACSVAANFYSDDNNNNVVKTDLGVAYFYSTCADQTDEDVKKLRARIIPLMKVADYDKAAEMGSREAIFEAASDHHLGILVPKDNFKADRLITMYGRKGKEQQDLADQIEAEMTPDEIQRAQASGNEWIQSFLNGLNQSTAAYRQAYIAARTEPYYGEEIVPSIGKYPDLDRRSLRWCLYRGKMLEYINHQVPDNKDDKNEIANQNVKLVTNAIAAKMETVVSDYKSRCPDGRQYLAQDEDVINNELKDSIYLNQVALEAQQLMLSWDRRFWFRE